MDIGKKIVDGAAFATQQAIKKAKDGTVFYKNNVGEMVFEKLENVKFKDTTLEAKITILEEQVKLQKKLINNLTKAIELLANKIDANQFL